MVEDSLFDTTNFRDLSQRLEPSQEIKNPRCVNLDWLEVHAREPIGQPRDFLYYFLSKGLARRET